MSSTPAVPQAFDATHAEAYDRSLERLQPIKATLHLLIRWQFSGLPEDARILLAGAGTGAEARFLAPLFPRWRFTLVDPSAPMLEVARRHATAEGFADRCEVHVGLVSSIAAELYDAAASVLVSHFLTDAGEREAYFAEIAGRLKPGGLLFNADLCADTESAAFAPVMDHWLPLVAMPDDRKATFRAAFGKAFAAHGPSGVEAMIERAGFTAPVPCFQALLIRGWMAARP
ncbi:MAG: class I SAM-dependent methyltransferase [Myxococcota bacterium]